MSGKTRFLEYEKIDPKNRMSLELKKLATVPEN